MKDKNNSPKGPFRTKELFIVGGVFLIIVALSGGFDAYGQWHLEKALSPNGWIFKQMNNMAEICMGLTMLYVGHRVINHFRTHDFIDEECDPHNLRALLMTVTWIIAIALVVGNALR